jgi:hypothetical protein
MQVPKDFLLKGVYTGQDTEPLISDDKIDTERRQLSTRVKRTLNVALGLGVMHLCISMVLFILVVSDQERVFRNDLDVLKATTCVKGHHNIFNAFQRIAVGRKMMIAVCIIMFHLLSGVFQTAPFLSRWTFYPIEYAHRIHTNNIMYLRYMEYSLSAPLVLISISLVIGVMDIFTLVFIGVLTMLCMLLGLIADMVRWTRRSSPVPDKRRMGYIVWALHFMGWVAVITSWVVILNGFYSAKHNLIAVNSTVCDVPRHLFNVTGTMPGNTTISKLSKPIEIPDFVEPLVWVEMFLFSIFGFVQLWQLSVEGGETIMITRKQWEGEDKVKREEFIGWACETAYVCLSFISKTVLGVVTFTNVLFTNDV